MPGDAIQQLAWGADAVAGQGKLCQSKLLNVINVIIITPVALPRPGRRGHVSCI
jgi:hypothetical protein